MCLFFLQYYPVLTIILLYYNFNLEVRYFCPFYFELLGELSVLLSHTFYSFSILSIQIKSTFTKDTLIEIMAFSVEHGWSDNYSGISSSLVPKQKHLQSFPFVAHSISCGKQNHSHLSCASTNVAIFSKIVGQINFMQCDTTV